MEARSERQSHPHDTEAHQLPEGTDPAERLTDSALPEPDNATGTTNTPPTTYLAGRSRPPMRMCARCHVTTETPVVVGVVHQNSGPGFVVYACRACAGHYPPQPDVLTLLPPSRQAEGGK